MVFEIVSIKFVTKMEIIFDGKFVTNAFIIDINKIIDEARISTIQHGSTIIISSKPSRHGEISKLLK